MWVCDSEVVVIMSEMGWDDLSGRQSVARAGRRIPHIWKRLYMSRARRLSSKYVSASISSLTHCSALYNDACVYVYRYRPDNVD